MELTDYQKEDIRFIENPGCWPKWPTLPMKSETEYGFLLDGVAIGVKPYPKDHPCLRTVYLLNPWEFFTREIGNRPKLKDIPTKVYESIESMILDGWMVD